MYKWRGLHLELIKVGITVISLGDVSLKSIGASEMFPEYFSVLIKARGNKLQFRDVQTFY
jgi:hypothetical protein